MLHRLKSKRRRREKERRACGKEEKNIQETKERLDKLCRNTTRSNNLIAYVIFPLDVVFLRRLKYRFVKSNTRSMRRSCSPHCRCWSLVGKWRGVRCNLTAREVCQLGNIPHTPYRARNFAI